MSSRPHHTHPPSGLSDEAASAEYDLIHQAEAEEQRLHPKDSMTEDPSELKSSGLGSSSTDTGKHEKQGSKLNKMKDTLLGKK